VIDGLKKYCGHAASGEKASFDTSLVEITLQI
jgi:hypothetical protein